MKTFTILLFIIIILSTCSSKPNVVESVSGDTAKVDGDIYVVSHGWHTGLVVPSKLIQSRIPELKHRFKNTPYIEFGWGDKVFYQSKEVTTGLILRAVFWPTESVIHAVAVPQKAVQYFPNSHVEKICLNSIEYSTLIQFIQNSFFRNKDDKIVKLKQGIYGDSQFYKAVGDFHLMNTCNKWTAKGLKSAGMDISTTFKLSAESVMDFLATNNQHFKHGMCPQTINKL